MTQKSNPLSNNSAEIIKQAQEMHKLNPSIPLKECLNRVIEKHRKKK